MPSRRPASPALRPFVELLWAQDRAPGKVPVVRERVLPTGMLHLVFRSAESGVRVLAGPDDTQGRQLPHAVVGGPRSRFYLREAAAAERSVGALLRPGGAQLLFGGAAAELAERHIGLEDLWGGAAADARDQLLACADPMRRLALLEELLLARLPRIKGMHPAVAGALAALPATPVGAVVTASGLSHRHFIAAFRRSVGLPPKAYARVLRFDHALARLGRGEGLADTAAAAGYCDQAHLGRDFADIAGIAPGSYVGSPAVGSRHVPLQAGQKNPRRAR
jgi:AraC-like DNA-binding protein